MSNERPAGGPTAPAPFDERAVLARLEAADTDELARLVAQPCAEEERVLRTYLGDDRYERLRGLALKRDLTRRGKRGGWRMPAPAS